MAEQVVLIDTSVLIDFFRKSDKSKSTLFSLYENGYSLCICAVTEYEIYTGATVAQLPYWETFLETFDTLNFDSRAATQAASINKALKIKRKQIETADLFIAAIAMSNNVPVATLNLKHFNRIDELSLIEIK